MVFLLVLIWGEDLENNKDDEEIDIFFRVVKDSGV